MRWPIRVLPVAIVLILAGLAQQPQKGWIGVTVETVTPALMIERKLAFPSGVLVTAIAPESPAVNGLKTGDVIILLNGQPVLTAEAFVSAIAALAPGNKAQPLIARIRGPRQHRAASLSPGPHDPNALRIEVTSTPLQSQQILANCTMIFALIKTRNGMTLSL